MSTVFQSGEALSMNEIFNNFCQDVEEAVSPINALFPHITSVYFL